MSTRGKVLRDTHQGDGLISVGGRQSPFSLERHWRSDTPPRVGMTVDVEFGVDGVVSAVQAIPDNEIAREEAARVLRAAQDRGLAAFEGIKRRFGLPVLVAWLSWLVAMTLLDLVRVSVSSVNVAAVSFWNLLALINNSSNLMAVLETQSMTNASRGIYAVLFFAGLASPVLPQFWRKPEAQLGFCGPLAVMLFAAISLYLAIRDAANAARSTFGQLGSMFGEAAGPDAGAGAMHNMMSQLMQAFHIGPGGYIGLAAAVYLAYVGVRGYLVGHAQGARA